MGADGLPGCMRLVGTDTLVRDTIGIWGSRPDAPCRKGPTLDNVRFSSLGSWDGLGMKANALLTRV